MPNYRLATERAARKYNVDPGILKALIQQESGFKEGVRSGAGAQDIAQFMPATAKAYGVTLGDGRVTDDLEGAAHYIADNLKKTGGNYHQALSIYNSGKADAYKDPNFAGGQTYNYVKTILANAGHEKNSSGSGSAAPPRRTSSTTTTTPGVDNSAQRSAAISAFLGDRQADPLSFAMQIHGLQDVPGATKTTKTSASSATPSSGTDLQGKLISRANAIDKKRMPYQWGGGHAGKVDAYKATPLDCSGAVSSVLGIDPKVSGEFEQFGKPGEGGSATIYANSHHVLMKVRGRDGQWHFFGTSGSNPGGGAGWIPAKNISPAYLQGFTARHI
jgi:hypothetical protein